MGQVSAAGDGVAAEGAGERAPVAGDPAGGKEQLDRAAMLLNSLRDLHLHNRPWPEGDPEFYAVNAAVSVAGLSGISDLSLKDFSFIERQFDGEAPWAGVPIAKVMAHGAKVSDQLTQELRSYFTFDHLQGASPEARRAYFQGLCVALSIALSVEECIEILSEYGCNSDGEFQTKFGWESETLISVLPVFSLGDDQLSSWLHGQAKSAQMQGRIFFAMNRSSAYLGNYLCGLDLLLSCASGKGAYCSSASVIWLPAAEGVVIERLESALLDGESMSAWRSVLISVLRIGGERSVDVLESLFRSDFGGPLRSTFEQEVGSTWSISPSEPFASWLRAQSDVDSGPDADQYLRRSLIMQAARFYRAADLVSKSPRDRILFILWKYGEVPEFLRGM